MHNVLVFTQLPEYVLPAAGLQPYFIEEADFRQCLSTYQFTKPCCAEKITIPIFVHKMSQQMTDQRAMIWTGKGCNFRTPSNDSTTPSI